MGQRQDNANRLLDAFKGLLNPESKDKEKIRHTFVLENDPHVRINFLIGRMYIDNHDSEVRNGIMMCDIMRIADGDVSSMAPIVGEVKSSEKWSLSRWCFEMTQPRLIKNLYITTISDGRLVVRFTASRSYPLTSEVGGGSEVELTFSSLRVDPVIDTPLHKLLRYDGPFVKKPRNILGAVRKLFSKRK